MTFRRAVESTPNLEGEWKAGLSALRAKDRPHIQPQDTRPLIAVSPITYGLTELCLASTLERHSCPAHCS